MREAAAEARDRNWDDPFIITSRTACGRKLISDLGVNESPPGVPRDLDYPVLPGRLRNRDIISQQRHAFILRLGGALIGGIALIGPMLLMLLHKSVVTSLVTTSVSVFAFGLGLALFSKDSMPHDIMVAVAGYAAFLVVFVGTNS
jgi:VIT1/CCC1 family predicted Fe2+/Mn2+ transporter